jgi:hypothetical protein
LYNLFKDHTTEHVYDSIPLFYHDWNDDASSVLLGCDNELQALCGILTDMDLSNVKSLKEHYEADTVSKMTEKLRSISAFSGLLAPMVKTGTGYAPDLTSRYFTEDYPFGLAIIKGFCVMADYATPYIDASLFWYQNITGNSYFLPDGRLGMNATDCGAPQRYGFETLDEVIALY